ncbi:uncharacterized protein LOC126845871 [Adelges cooleyi]|uniref:uncharacterized protein LOC126845871 n=1 Tax=Adelges cooleyi TaxID=133065 RepID=UPI00217F88EE|nr:uncharacterized protein LOC126845871 [Adelges cooleyi]
MANHKNDDKSFITNVRLLKMTGLYQVLNPVNSEGSTMLWGCNIYQLAHILVTPLNVIIVIFCVIGLIAWTNDLNQRLNICMLLVAATNTLLNAIRVSKKSDVIWKCFEIMRDDFLSYNYYKTDIVKYYKRKTVIITNIYSSAFCLLLIIWLGNPVFITDYTVKNSDGDLVPYRNSVLNVLPYPFKVDLYNKLFPIIYIIEAVILTQCVIGFIIFDSVLIIFCWSIVAHLKTIASTYSSLGYEKIENESIIIIEKFKIIISDHTKVISVMRDFFHTIRPIIVTQIGITACVLVCATYAYIANYFYGMPIMSATSMKYLSAAMFSVPRLFVLTKFCGLVDNKVNSMNLSLYSCNWLDQDLSFRRLVLLAMTMNSVNMKTITITPMKNVDLKIFTNVLHMAYSIISVLLKKKLSEQN